MRHIVVGNPSALVKVNPIEIRIAEKKIPNMFIRENK
jgi:hypothetical protein